jgi:hypothetical protein
MGARNGLFGFERPNTLQLEGGVIGPAIPPGLAGLEATNQHVLRMLAVVSSGVTIRGLIAATDVTASDAHTKVNPSRSDLDALFAARAGRHGLGRRVGDVCAVFVHGAGG